MIQSPAFWAFVFAAVLLYGAVPLRWRYGFLALLSFGYLLMLAPFSVAALLGFGTVFYFVTPLAARKDRTGWGVAAGLMVLILGFLAYFKYIPPLVAAVFEHETTRHFLIPLGISYYSFKLVHYVVEVSRGNVRDFTLADVLCWLYLFPIFTAGPIERFDHFMTNEPTRSAEDIGVGLTRIIHGLVKRFVIVELLILPLFRGVTDGSELLIRLEALPSYKVGGFLVLSYLSTYMDFSAYSDIAIGVSRLFGITIMENFNWPILAPNIGNFWKRWHMTLAGWCQSYIYMPILGLTRSPYAAVYATMFIMSLWHAGALHWVCWGLYHATGVAVYLTWARRLRKRRWKPLATIPVLNRLGVLVTFLFVTGSYAFTTVYSHGTLYDSLRVLAKLVMIDLPAGGG